MRYTLYLILLLAIYSICCGYILNRLLAIYYICVLAHLGDMFVGEHRLELHSDELLDLVGLAAAERDVSGLPQHRSEQLQHREGPKFWSNRIASWRSAV